MLILYPPQLFYKGGKKSNRFLYGWQPHLNVVYRDGDDIHAVIAKPDFIETQQSDTYNIFNSFGKQESIFHLWISCQALNNTITSRLKI